MLCSTTLDEANPSWFRMSIYQNSTLVWQWKCHKACKQSRKPLKNQTHRHPTSFLERPRSQRRYRNSSCEHRKQLADIFTKPLDESRFYVLCSELNILDSHNVDWTIAHLDWWTSMDRRNELERFKYCTLKWFIIRNKCIMIIVCIDYLLLIIVCLRFVSISYMYIAI